MKILLKKDIKALGKIGDVVDVANGYARNYLLPKKFAASEPETAIIIISMLPATAPSQNRAEATRWVI